MKASVLPFCAVLAGCAAVSATVPVVHSCRNTEDPCVDASMQWTGYCCPHDYACSGPPPNVGCGTKIGDDCCPTQGGFEKQRHVPQRLAR